MTVSYEIRSAGKFTVIREGRELTAVPLSICCGIEAVIEPGDYVVAADLAARWIRGEIETFKLVATGLLELTGVGETQ